MARSRQDRCLKEVGALPRGTAAPALILSGPSAAGGHNPAAPRDSSKDSEGHLGSRGQVIPSESYWEGRVELCLNSDHWVKVTPDAPREVPQVHPARL